MADRRVESLRFAPADPTAAPARQLLAAMTGEIDGLYPDFESAVVSPVDPSEMVAPHGRYLVGWAGETPVAGGGLRRLAEGVVEIKRMYVVPSWRGRGVAGALLGALEAAAVELGYRTARLDTGPRQPHARRLYEHAGYRSVPCYNRNRRASFWGEKELGTPTTARP